ncbi:MAG: LD-carboxypeptidase [Deltaproteobacteria bacterium CG11_big_fil_rev_8_21_14_0_20_49_13]|nr:MAG: LD-carboxypeptidase [Deltaproteobacteria bacterium CG11_big_fil_rev_8_21_14_0_20_49_13]
MIKPGTLQKDDLIAVAAPASPFARAEFVFAVKKLRALGFKVTFRKDIFAKDRYLAGTDERRADEINSFFAESAVKAICFARGGYGTQRILPLLDIETIKANPKIVFGYSDITALHIYLYHHGIGGSFYGPTIARHLKHAPQKTIDILFGLLSSASPAGRLPVNGAKAFKKGTAEGTLIGGCLSLVTTSIGTPYELPTDDAILFLEDVGEPVYVYDRMLTHLKAAGLLRNVKGIVFGTLGLKLNKNEKTAWLKKTLDTTLGDFPGPIVTNFPTGHLDLKSLFVTLPLGVKARLRTEPLELEIVESALSF